MSVWQQKFQWILLIVGRCFLCRNTPDDFTKISKDRRFSLGEQVELEEQSRLLALIFLKILSILASKFVNHLLFQRKVSLTLLDIRSGKDSLFTRPNRISQDRKNIKLFLQWLFSTKGYQFSISRFSNANLLYIYIFLNIL